MASSRCHSLLGLTALHIDSGLVPSRTPGPMGYLDSGDPDVSACPGDSPGSLGILDHGDPATPGFHLVPLLRFDHTADLEEFEETVLEQHVKRADRSKVRAKSIPESELMVVEGKFKLRTQAAIACRLLLAEARGALNKEKADFAKKSKKEQEAELAESKKSQIVHVSKVTYIGLSSAYRSFEYDAALWHSYFRTKYYPENVAKLSSISRSQGGKHGWKAAQMMVAFIAKRKAAPGFSNHTNGIAVDFVTKEGGETLQAETGHNEKALNKVNARWERSWFYKWIDSHKENYHVHRIPTEAWHWEFTVTPPQKGDFPTPDFTASLA